MIGYLDCVSRGKHDIRSLVEHMIDIRTKFEIQKSRALATGRRMNKEELLAKRKGFQLARRSKELSVQLGLVSMNDTAVLTEKGLLVLRNGLDDEATRRFLITRFLMTYPVFRDVLFAIRNTPEGKIALPLRRGKDFFTKSARKYGINSDQWNYELARDIGTQLELLNWSAETSDNVRTHVVYLITRLVRLSEVRSRNRSSSGDAFTQVCIKQLSQGVNLNRKLSADDVVQRARLSGYIDIPQDRDIILMKNVDFLAKDFEQAIWEEYLGITDSRPMHPVFYSKLRDRVCERLRISDRVFDHAIMTMLNQPTSSATRVYAGGGALPELGRSLMRKYLPPRTGTDEYVTYLKLDRLDT